MSKDKDVFQSTSDGPSDSKKKDSVFKKVTKGGSTEKEKKERAKSAAETTGRKIVDEKDANDEMRSKKKSLVRTAAKAWKEAPLTAKVAIFGAVAYNSHVNKELKKYEKQMNDWQRHDAEAKAHLNGDTFSSSYQRIMSQYNKEKLEKKAKRLQKHRQFQQNMHNCFGRMIGGMQRGTQVMAQKETQEAMIGESQNKTQVLSTSALGSIGSVAADYSVDMGSNSLDMSYI